MFKFPINNTVQSKIKLLWGETLKLDTHTVEESLQV